MIIVTISDKGGVKLPVDAVQHLGNARHLQVRLNAHGITLTPVHIQAAAKLKAVPEGRSSTRGAA